MKVMCINGHENVLTEGNTYTVVRVSAEGNFLLEEVEVPAGYTHFNPNRFIPIQGTEDSEYFENLKVEFYS